MSISFSIRCAFVCVVAVLGAAIADPLMECASNAGWFGAGHFTDRSTVDVLPALAVAVFAACMLAGLQIAKLVTGRAAGWILASDAVLRKQSLLRALPVAFGLQLAVLYGMETLEQLVVRGHMLGGTIWLGGPAAISLLVHAIVCLCVAFAALRLLRAFTRVAGSIIARIFEPASRSPQPLANRLRGRRNGIASLQRICVLAHLRERAPPLLRT
ncbi:MAG: hypothetical protein ACYDGM_00735 [Vulcanimicrobiaceae bacterium]